MTGMSTSQQDLRSEGGQAGAPIMSTSQQDPRSEGGQAGAPIRVRVRVGQGVPQLRQSIEWFETVDLHQGMHQGETTENKDANANT